MPTFTRRERIPHPATGAPIDVWFDRPATGHARYVVKIEYLGHGSVLPFTTPLGQPVHAADVLEDFAATAPLGESDYPAYCDLFGLPTGDPAVRDEWKTRIAFTRKMRRLFRDDYQSFIDTDWSTHRNVHGRGREVWRREEPFSA